ncbi:TetR/AcrR family transcriptional regulator [Leifsonia poae]|uniref:TetR family transcriptional regulator n=1 Tax=Leifsonia poae TaxID=110933 RepID=A0A9W6H9Z4_9MICO|nr:TetR/AcrR family transcriptional regulator [Leifsonia poae]GLJ76270.1 TetR family transcriptional regulator [Leifsonia poae]
MSEHRRGPARSEVARVAILEATARQFATRGYDHLTMEGIAADAKVGKQTIYRWWSSKGALVADCLIEGLLLPDDLNPPDTGDLRADLTDWLGSILAIAQHPGGEALMRSLISAAAENEDVGRRLHESLGASSSLIVRLQAGVDAGQLPAGAPLTEIGEALVGAVILRAISRVPAEEATTARLVQAVLPAG